MTSLRAVLENIPPLRSPERVATSLVVVVAIVAVALIATPRVLDWIDDLGFGAAVPSASISPSPAASASAGTSTAPASADVRAVATIEERLAGLAASVEREVAARPRDVSALVTLLRQVNATLVAGAGPVGALSRAPASASLGADLAAAHAAIARSVKGTLELSLSQEAAYVSGSLEVAKLLRGLAPLDARLAALLASRSPSASP